MNNMDDIIPDESEEYNTLSKQLALVQKHGWAIDYIKNPSEDVQLAAVKQTGFVIECIRNPSEVVQLAAVNSSASAFGFILEKEIAPSIPVQKAAVMKDPFGALLVMIEHDFPISKMIQWTAAKLIKEQNMVSDLYEDELNKLDLDVQKYLKFPR